VLVPVVLTWYVLLSLFRFLDGFTGQVVEQLIGHSIPGLGLVVTVSIVLITGALARSLLGRELIHLGQSILAGTPIVRGVYSTIRQIVDAFALTEQTAFQRVVLVEYPRPGMYAVAFVTAGAPPAAERLAGEELVSVFLPTTPNPTSGFLLMIPRQQLRLLDIPVEEGLKLVISGGIAGPGVDSRGDEQPDPDGAPEQGPPKAPRPAQASQPARRVAGDRTSASTRRGAARRRR
jgi:uncharacterized membrane protein